MFFKRDMTQLICAGLMALSLSATGQASETIDVTAESIIDSALVPVVNPSRNCAAVNPSKIPEGVRDYSFLYNDDCSVHFVLPPGINTQAIRETALPSLRFCSVVRSIGDRIAEITKSKGTLQRQMSELYMNLSTASENQMEAIGLKIETLARHIERLDKLGNDAHNEKQRMETIEGAIVNVTLDSRVLGRDLAKLADAARHPMIGPNGEFLNTWTGPRFMPARTTKSIYSFTLRRPEDEEGMNPVMETNIPGLEQLVQPGSVTQTVHVQADGVLSGLMRLRLSAVCGNEVEIKPHQYAFDPNNSLPMLTVNQTYQVQQQFAYGYRAEFDHKEVVERLIEDTVESLNNGFTKEQVFKNELTLNSDSMLKFEWENNFNPGTHEDSMDTIMAIKEGVFNGFVDNYLEKLVFAGKLETVEPAAVSAVDGGMVDVDQVGTRCTSKRRNWFGRTRQSCSNYTYKVKEWRNGILDKELRDDLTLEVNDVEIVSANEMVPFYFTSTFVR